MTYAENGMPAKNPLSAQIDLSKFSTDDFVPASAEEKAQQEVMGESVSFFKDGLRRLMRNKLAMGSIIVLLVMVVAIIMVVLVAVAVLMPMLVFVVVMFFPVVVEMVLAGGLRGGGLCLLLAVHRHRHVVARDAAGGGRLGLQPHPGEPQAVHGIQEPLLVLQQFIQGGHEHIPGGPHIAFQVKCLHLIPPDLPFD